MNGMTHLALSPLQQEAVVLCSQVTWRNRRPGVAAGVRQHRCCNGRAAHQKLAGANRAMNSPQLISLSLSILPVPRSTNSMFLTYAGDVQVLQ